MKASLVLLALSIGVPCQAFAQDLAPGARVRVTLERQGAPLVGTLLALPPEALELRVEPDSTARTILRPDIARLEISGGMRSRSSRGAERGALIVGAIGALAGFAFAAIIPTRFDYRPVLPVVGLGGGALLGAGIGAITTRGRYERWETVPVP
jgi:hypothetical protein